MVKPAEPISAEEMVLAALFTVKVGVVPPREIMPPDRTTAPDADPKVREFASTVPETAIVPAERPSVEVPKFRASAVVVLVVPERALEPSGEVVQPWVELLVVGAAQTPPAVPKPAVASFASQYKVDWERAG